jgi:hypothetical protein
MALHAASYFAGVGTVVATMTFGFGGGILLTDAVVGKNERTPTLMERRAAPPETPAPVVANAPSPQAAEQQAAAPASTPAPAAAPSRAAAQAIVAQQPAVAPSPTPAHPPAQTSKSNPQLQAGTAVQPGTSLPAMPDRTRFEQTMGRAQDAKPENRAAETRKATAERRKQERRKWAERRKREMQKIDELTAMSEKVREADRSREREGLLRSFATESPTLRPSPMIGLFGDVDDETVEASPERNPRSRRLSSLVMVSAGHTPRPRCDEERVH